MSFTEASGGELGTDRLGGAQVRRVKVPPRVVTRGELTESGLHMCDGRIQICQGSLHPSVGLDLSDDKGPRGGQNQQSRQSLVAGPGAEPDQPPL